MGKKTVMLPVTQLDFTTVKYDPAEIEAPHITGFGLKLFVKLVEMPFIGSLIIGHLKKQNKMNQGLRETVIPEPPMFRPEFPPQGTKTAYQLYSSSMNSFAPKNLEDVVPKFSTKCDVEWVDADDPLFLLYTSGSTGKPKGILHTTGGYMVYTAATFKYAFDYKPSDIYWCTADCGWITGHSYVAYGPLLNGATVFF